MDSLYNNKKAEQKQAAAMAEEARTTSTATTTTITTLTRRDKLHPDAEWYDVFVRGDGEEDEPDTFDGSSQAQGDALKDGVQR